MTFGMDVKPDVGYKYTVSGQGCSSAVSEEIPLANIATMQTAPNEGDGLSGGAIAGIVIGSVVSAALISLGLLALIAVAIAVAFVWRKKKSHHSDVQPDKGTYQAPLLSDP